MSRCCRYCVATEKPASVSSSIFPLLHQLSGFLRQSFCTGGNIKLAPCKVGRDLTLFGRNGFRCSLRLFAMDVALARKDLARRLVRVGSATMKDRYHRSFYIWPKLPTGEKIDCDVEQ